MKLIDKVKCCCDYRSLLKLQKDLHKHGLTIESLQSGQHILCKIQNGKPVAEDLFIDYIYLEKSSLLEDINDLKRDVIADFIERNISSEELLDQSPSNINQNSLYGKAFGV